MSIPESVVEAAHDQGDEFFHDDARTRAGRVLLALTKNIPEDAVKETTQYLRVYCGIKLKDYEVKAAVTVFLASVVKEPS